LVEGSKPLENKEGKDGISLNEALLRLNQKRVEARAADNLKQIASNEHKTAIEI